ncbi:hypothetical protein BDV40DRAFT_297834 [Aspergillus tamarii]|uniref:Uncharacterized protein n=1 Tax=Aspergillus tamarii TaxID=41984 RepID=A0A5N6V2P5_ASPTM|nr:hypothetical protein BDV40DRAFT_297834 [Aspergillus tamarii]
MASFIKERDFGPVPIFADALGEFYLNELTAIEEQYHKLPDLTATERTTKEERKTAFANMLSELARQGPFAGLTLYVRLELKIESVS